jgi:threonyl-tRNA synthetase
MTARSAGARARRPRPRWGPRRRDAQRHRSRALDDGPEPPDPDGRAVEIEPILADALEGLGVIRHSTAHLLAAAVLDLFPGTKLSIGPALMDDPRFGFFYDVIAPRPNHGRRSARHRGAHA